MKNIFFIIAITSVLLFGKPCMTDIYTGNGINTTDREAWENMKALRTFMLKKARAASRLDISKYNVDYSFKYIHNPDHGFNNDMMETYYQLKETGQISDGYFHTMFSFLAGDIPETALHAKYMDIVGTYEGDVNSIYWKYYNMSFSKKHNVLLVAHSQGNLIGNKIYTLLNEDEKNKFRMVSVATPANHVAGGGPYVTVHGDHVIQAVPGALAANTAGIGHNFITTYLYEHSSVYANARHLIASYVKSAYSDLVQTTSCTKYWAINMKLDTEGIMEVFGYPILGGREIYVANSVGTVDFKPYDLAIEKDVNGNIIKRCNMNTDSVKYWGDIDLCYGGNDDTCGWKAGEIYSKPTLEARKNLNYTMTSKDYTKCINIAHSGELYELTKDLFE